MPNTGETLSARMLRVLAPISAFLIMPLFALANTAMKIGGGAAAGAAAGGSAAATAAAATGGAMAAGVGLGLLIGKPLGIVGFSLLSQKLGLASLSKEMNLAHLGIVGLLGGIGFTMCLRLTEVAITGPTQALHEARRPDLLRRGRRHRRRRDEIASPEAAPRRRRRRRRPPPRERLARRGARVCVFVRWSWLIHTYP